jgi:dihydroorotate dehydrogenase (NAD+) catalytic subunit
MRWWCAAGTWQHDAPPAGFDVYVAKTATLHPRLSPGPLVRRALPDDGYLNRVGIRNPGLAALLADLPVVRGALIVSILGFEPGEWGTLAGLVEEGAVADGLELNLSCPNTEAEPVSVDLAVAAEAVREARRAYNWRLGAKLSPTVSTDVARACEAEGADYLCLTNSLGIAFGGLSGRPLRALALDCIARCAAVVSIPIVGGGGIMTREDAGLYVDAGATDVFMGSANIVGVAR